MSLVFNSRTYDGISIENIIVKDIRFPTSLGGHGSDAMHTDPDYSCAYVILQCTNTSFEGHGLTFTIGQGTEIVVEACKSLSKIVLNKKLSDIAANYREFLKSLTCHSQLRWLGPEKGVIHLASAAIINAIWDLIAKIEQRPFWKLLVDMTPEQIISICDFSYLSDALNEQEALDILRDARERREEREKEMIEIGFPVYTTSAGWLNYDDEEIRRRVVESLDKGFTKFKLKVGENLENDRKRCNFVRSLIGWDRILMVDANQRWDVQQSIDWMIELKDCKPLWIEEPTSPDDVIGYKTIAQALAPYNIRVAGGEHCQNRVMFKQFITQGAIQFCQIDSCRVAGPSEIIPIMLMAKKYNVPVCPHAGGVGLCEYIQHLCIFDYICVAATLENRFGEWADHLRKRKVIQIVA